MSMSLPVSTLSVLALQFGTSVWLLASSQNELQSWRRSNPYVKQVGDRQLATLLVVASVFLTLVCTHTAKLFLIRDQRSVVSTVDGSVQPSVFKVR